MRDIAIGIGAVLAVLGTTVVLVLFFSFRSDAKASGYPEPTVLAVRQTLSTIKTALRIKRGEKEKRVATHPRRYEDMGTINRPMPPIPPRKRDSEP